MAKQRINISLDEEIVNQLKEYANERHTTVSQAITDWTVEAKKSRKMNGFGILAASYEKMVKEGRLTKEEAEGQIRIYDFLSECDDHDLFTIVDSGAFNDIMKAYFKKAMNNVGIEEEVRDRTIRELEWIFDESLASEIMSK